MGLGFLKDNGIAIPVLVIPGIASYSLRETSKLMEKLFYMRYPIKSVPKHHFWVGVKGGLLDKKHYLGIGSAVWLFMYLLLNQTHLNQAGEGVANYGHPLTIEQISYDMRGISVRTILKWADRLRRKGYIRTKNHGHDGLSFWIAKGKDKTKQRRIQTELAQKAALSPRPKMGAKESSTRPNLGTEDGPPFPNKVRETGEIGGQFLLR